MLKAAGFEGVEPHSHFDQEEVLRARDKSGLLIPSVQLRSAFTRAFSYGPRENAPLRWKESKQALRDAKRYGASSILVVPGGVERRDALRRGISADPIGSCAK